MILSIIPLLLTSYLAYTLASDLTICTHNLIKINSSSPLTMWSVKRVQLIPIVSTQPPTLNNITTSTKEISFYLLLTG